ncbi:hypothetical protein ACLOJK_013232 [Asimina triloba]
MKRVCNSKGTYDKVLRLLMRLLHRPREVAPLQRPQLALVSPSFRNVLMSVIIITLVTLTKDTKSTMWTKKIFGRLDRLIKVLISGDPSGTDKLYRRALIIPLASRSKAERDRERGEAGGGNSPPTSGEGRSWWGKQSSNIRP